MNYNDLVTAMLESKPVTLDGNGKEQAIEYGVSESEASGNWLIGSLISDGTCVIFSCVNGEDGDTCLSDCIYIKNLVTHP